MASPASLRVDPPLGNGSANRSAAAAAAITAPCAALARAARSAANRNHAASAVATDDGQTALRAADATSFASVPSSPTQPLLPSYTLPAPVIPIAKTNRTAIPKENKKMHVDLNTTFQARNASSRAKAMRFFGEHRIPILVGSGSAIKIGSFYGANVVSHSVKGDRAETPAGYGRSDTGGPSIPHVALGSGWAADVESAAATAAASAASAANTPRNAPKVPDLGALSPNSHKLPTNGTHDDVGGAANNNDVDDVLSHRLSGLSVAPLLFAGPRSPVSSDLPSPASPHLPADAATVIPIADHPVPGTPALEPNKSDNTGSDTLSWATSAPSAAPHLSSHTSTIEAGSSSATYPEPDFSSGSIFGTIGSDPTRQQPRRILPSLAVATPVAKRPSTVSRLPSKPEFPAGQLRAAMDESRSIDTSPDFISAAWRRHDSHASFASSQDPSETDIAQLDWLQETQRSSESSQIQMPKGESMTRSLGYTPHPMSLESLLLHAETQTELAFIPALKPSPQSFKCPSLLETAVKAATDAEVARNSALTLATAADSAREKPLAHPSALASTQEGPGTATSTSGGHLRVSLTQRGKPHTRDSLGNDTYARFIGSRGPSAADKPIYESKRNSMRKLMSIFGEACPIDVPVHHIEQDGLWAMLTSNLPLCYFMLNLLKEHSPEILFFVIDAHNFEQTVFDSNSSLQRAAHDLFDLYLSKDAVFELNVTHKARRAVANGIHSSSLQCFRKALEEISVLLEGTYARFRKSPYFTMMREHLGLHTVLHQEATARLVLELLREAVPRENISLGMDRHQQIVVLRSRLDLFLQGRISLYLVNGAR